jgi:Fe-S cluster biogenesis protein NfuA
MWTQVEQAVEDLRPLVGSIGLDLRVEDVLERVVTLEVVRTDPSSRPDMDRLRDFVTRELREQVPEVVEVRFVGEVAVPAPPAGPTVEITPPDPESETVVLRVSVPVGPSATSTFDRAEDAVEWPVVRGILGLRGVVSVVARERLLIVARDSSESWEAVLPQIEPTVHAALVGGTAGDLEERIQTILDRDINPALSAHGGYIEIVELRGTELYIHMGGGCQGCAQSTATLRQGVEQQLRAHVPEITAIHDGTDHDAGQNPYFR